MGFQLACQCGADLVVVQPRFFLRGRSGLLNDKADHERRHDPGKIRRKVEDPACHWSRPSGAISDTMSRPPLLYELYEEGNVAQLFRCRNFPEIAADPIRGVETVERKKSSGCRFRGHQSLGVICVRLDGCDLIAHQVELGLINVVES